MQNNKQDQSNINAQADNTIVLYFNGKAIVIDEWDNVFYAEIPREFVTIGEVLLSHELLSLDILADKEKKEIMRLVEKL